MGSKSLLPNNTSVLLVAGKTAKLFTNEQKYPCCKTDYTRSVNSDAELKNSYFSEVNVNLGHPHLYSASGGVLVFFLLLHTILTFPK